MPDREGEHIARAWTEGAPADDLTVARNLAVVLSVRVTEPLHRRLAERAARAGRTESQVARDLIEAGLASDLPTTPSELARAFTRWVDEVQRMSSRGGAHASEPEGPYER